MSRTTLDISLKGKRNYVQGPDMLNAVMEHVGYHLPFPVRKVDFTMHRMTARQLFLEICETRGVPRSEEVAVMTLVGEEGQTLWAVLQESDRAPSGRTQDKEQLVFQLCEIDPAVRSVELKAASELSWAEAVVAMTKFLHNSLRPLPVSQQWVVCRLICPDWAACDRAPAGLRIKIDRTLGTRLTKSSVSRGEEVIADILFATRELT